MKVKSESEVAQSCPTLSDPMDCSLPGSCIHGIFQARVLEWGAIRNRLTPPLTKDYLVQNVFRAEAEAELGGSNRKVEMILKKVSILEVTDLKQCKL